MRQLRNILVLAALLLAGCQKEDGLRGLPEGAIRLTAEGFHGGEKTSVSGTSVQWDGNSSETVTINGNDYEVLISGNKAYIDPGSNVISTPVRGYYACGSVVTPDNSQPDAVTVEIPDSYDCSMSGGRQVIALPLAAYSSSSNTTVAFKHLTAAVDVLVWNATGENLCVDRVVVTVAGHRLHGSLDLDLAAENFGMAGSYDDPVSEADSSVSVTFPSSGEGSLVIEPGEENAKSIQVPILPVDNDHDITVRVFTHVSGSPWHKYAFSHHASFPNALTRNKMLTAKCKIHTGEGNHVTESKFTINDNHNTVYFSLGNLQYIGSAATPYWKFADNQWDYFGTTTGQNSSNANKDRDLFGWGTSGYNHGATAYQPYSTSTNDGHYWAYGDKSKDLNVSTGKADWGYNAILNGGNTENFGWKTLSSSEWEYIFLNRSYSYRYAKANIHNTNGLIIFPDGFNPSAFGVTITTANTANASYTAYSDDDWIRLEGGGCIFLPAAGSREEGTSVYDAGSWGRYWSRTIASSNYSVYNAYRIMFNPSSFSIGFNARHNGFSVRLVINAE